MPTRNSVKRYDSQSYYHIYNRGANKQNIFNEDEDREKFLSLFDRYLGEEEVVRGDGLPYEKYDAQIVAYCLMSNHFHLLAFQEDDPEAITKLMRSISTAYSMYFNQKFKHSGSLFQGVYKASRIDSDAYLMHITRYIHMNPRSYLKYKWSSLPSYLGGDAPSWLSPDMVNDMGSDEYLEFLAEYEHKKDRFDNIKFLLADRGAY